MARTARKGGKRSVDELSRRGPHEVLVGDLALVGLPGVVFTPATGLGLPAVAFGHGWLQPAHRYADLLRHLASWGIVAACPGTQRGPFPSHRQYAADLRATLDVCAGVRLGVGEISVDPGRMAIGGHCMGGGAAVLAASADDRVRAVVTLAPAQTSAAILDAARQVSVPSLHLAAGKDRVTPSVGHAGPVAQAWGGDAQLRTLPKASHLGFTDGRHWSDMVIDGSPESGTRKVTRALVTAFLLRHLTGDRTQDAVLDGDLKAAKLTDPAEV